MKQTAKRRTQSMKRKVLSYFFLSMLMFCLVISAFALIVADRVVRERVVAQYAEAMRTVGQQVERDLSDISDITDYLFVNRDVKRILRHFQLRDYTYVRASDAMDTLLSQYVTSNVFGNLNAMVIFSDEEQVYQFSADDHYRSFSIERMLESPAYHKAIETKRIVFSPQSESDSFSANNGHTLSAFRSILDEKYQKRIGGVFLSIRLEAVHNDMLKGEGAQLTTELTDMNGRSMTETGRALDANVWESILEGIAQENGGVVDRIVGDTVYFCYPLERFACCAVGSVPLLQLNAGRSTLIWMLGMALCVSIGLCLVIWRFMDRRFLKPLGRVSHSLRRMSKGAFEALGEDAHCGIEEIDTLAHNYNRAVMRIDTLVETLVEERTTYKELEYKALQSQINSHFITNTLNAVRWMAIMQKADNIKAAIDAFSRLLKSTWQGLDTQSTIAQELSNVRDYIYLQQLTHSYHCEISYDVDDALLDGKCIKFVLQPLVENAFFHGIGTKQEGGTINIGMRRDGSDVLLWVRDNGVGMDEETIHRVLSVQAEHSRFNGIGINNIHERLSMRYGPEYGVSIESELGSYTIATVRIPFEKGEALYDPSDDR